MEVNEIEGVIHHIAEGAVSVAAADTAAFVGALAVGIAVVDKDAVGLAAASIGTLAVTTIVCSATASVFGILAARVVANRTRLSADSVPEEDKPMYRKIGVGLLAAFVFASAGAGAYGLNNLLSLGEDDPIATSQAEGNLAVSAPRLSL